MRHISTELALIMNLNHLALDHKERCDHNCNVSLYMLRDAARYISREIIKTDEQMEAQKLIDEMPIT